MYFALGVPACILGARVQDVYGPSSVAMHQPGPEGFGFYSTFYSKFVYSAMECSLRLDQSIDRNGVEPIHPDEFLFSSWPLSLVDAGAKYLIEYRNAF